MKTKISTSYFLYEAWSNRDAVRRELLGTFSTEGEAQQERQRRIDADSKYTLTGSFYSVTTEELPTYERH